MKKPDERPAMYKAGGCEGCSKNCKWNHGRVVSEKPEGNINLYGCNSEKECFLNG